MLLLWLMTFSVTGSKFCQHEATPCRWQVQPSSAIAIAYFLPHVVGTPTLQWVSPSRILPPPCVVLQWFPGSRPSVFVCIFSPCHPRLRSTSAEARVQPPIMVQIAVTILQPLGPSCRLLLLRYPPQGCPSFNPHSLSEDPLARATIVLSSPSSSCVLLLLCDGPLLVFVGVSPDASLTSLSCLPLLCVLLLPPVTSLESELSLPPAPVTISFIVAAIVSCMAFIIVLMVVSCIVFMFAMMLCCTMAVCIRSWLTSSLNFSWLAAISWIIRSMLV